MKDQDWALTDTCVFTYYVINPFTPKKYSKKADFRKVAFVRIQKTKKRQNEGKHKFYFNNLDNK